MSAKSDGDAPPPSEHRLTAQQFIERWAGRAALTERAAAQSHFTDLCRLLGVSGPTDNRVNDSDYGFEARTDISASGISAMHVEDGLPYYRIETGTGGGFADVWKRDHFAWEYKRAGKHPTLASALAQLRVYAPSLGNPPLLIVSDIDRFEIHTNFTHYPPTTYTFHITELAKASDAWRTTHPAISPFEVLRKVFDDPQWFKPKKTRQAITGEYAEEIGRLAIALRDSGNEPHAVAHFLMQIVFCFFAEDIGLLPRSIFTSLIEKSLTSSADFPQKARALFKAMELGGHFGADTIKWFNGGLYQDVDADPVITIAPQWLGTLLMVAKRDWNAVDPTIFGTLFERSLDPDKRSQIGAHYTSFEDILLIVEPVIMQPLRRKWVDIQRRVAQWSEQLSQPNQTRRQKANLTKKIEQEIDSFCDQLARITVLDPACGSGNFLFVIIRQLLALEQEVLAFARDKTGVYLLPRVQPKQLRGIDVNDYACELARVSIWIGYLQWLHANTAQTDRKPILDPLDTIEHRDAILAWVNANGAAIEVWEEGAACVGRAEWPEADYIIGNPPFLGSKLFRKWGIPDPYLDAMYGKYELPNTSDLCCYWFEQARKAIVGNRVGRVGLLATQGIRGRENRTVLERIKKDGDIFMAWSDREWILDGAAVHVSMIGFDAGEEPARILNGKPVTAITTDLYPDIDFTQVQQLIENDAIAFMGDTKGGAFDIDVDVACRLLARPALGNCSNHSVIRPWVNGADVTKRPRGMYIIDFGCDASETEASHFEAPFEHIAKHVRSKRSSNRREAYALRWWIHVEPRPAMRDAIEPLSRFLITTRVAKHRLFRWFEHPTLADSATFCFARSDDYFFGVLQSSLHSIWALRLGTQLETRPRYTPTTCFETFPLPWPPGQEPVDDPHYKAIAAAAKELDELRERWLNPPQWIGPIADAVDRFEDFTGVPEQAKPLLRQSAIMARAAKDKQLKKRTLTNLYNERPSWLKLAHRTLDEAVLAAYAHIDPQGNWDVKWAEAYEPFGAGEITIIEKGKNKDSAEAAAAKRAAIDARKNVDEAILANLLRLNQQRAGG